MLIRLTYNLQRMIHSDRKQNVFELIELNGKPRIFCIRYGDVHIRFLLLW